jgi:hypothetical protein
VRGGCEGPARAGARPPRALGGVIAQDFGFRGILTANKLSKFRVSELGAVPPGTIRAERARARRSGPGGGSAGLNGIARGTIPSYVGQFIYPSSGVRPLYLSSNMTKCQAYREAGGLGRSFQRTLLNKPQSTHRG